MGGSDFYGLAFREAPASRSEFSNLGYCNMPAGRQRSQAERTCQISLAERVFGIQAGCGWRQALIFAGFGDEVARRGIGLQRLAFKSSAVFNMSSRFAGFARMLLSAARS